VSLNARLARWTPFASRYAEVAPACCNACRSCTATNAFALLGIVAGALAAPFARLTGRVKASG
jgi:hypothetical protein